jgi:hypothetical protein
MIVAKLSASAAGALRRALESARGSHPVLECPGVARVVPHDARGSDPELSTFFSIDAHHTDRADELADRLRALPGVEAAYVKPADEPP